MPEDTDSLKSAALFVGGMVVPVAGALLLHDVLALYLSGPELVSLVAIGFGAVSWLFLTVVDPEDLAFLSVSLVLPWVVVLVTVGLVLATGVHPGVRYLMGEIGELVSFGASFMIAGLAALVVRRRTERLANQVGWMPSSRRLALVLSGVLVVLLLGGAGMATVSASTATIASVDSGVVDHRAAGLNVTVDGQPAEYRLTVVAPNGDSYTRRVSPTGSTRRTTTVAVPFYRLGSPQAGTYRVEVRAITGVLVDAETYTIETPPRLSVLDVKTVGPGESLAFDLPANATIYRPSPGPTDPETRVAVILTNTGDVAGEFDVVVHLKPGLVDGREIFVRPGQTGANVIAIDDQHVDRLREEENGTVTVEVSYEDTTVTRTVELPPAE